MTVQHAFKIGDVIEAKDPSHYPGGWRRAWISELSPYRGKPGYYIRWCEVPDAPDGIKLSSGGWIGENLIRPINS